MKIVMTLMVRDEVDIVAAMIEHHLAQGVDLIIATDNASIDGTREVLARYQELGVLELHDDPEHRKQQHAVVTEMARRAYAVHGADWVLNADADEFWLPVNHDMTLREALEKIPPSVVSFEAPVVNLTGRPAERGSGISRLTWRDLRSDDDLMLAAGLHAQPTPNTVHVGHPDVTVAQGNHFTNLVAGGEPPRDAALEVLHLPWRSWSQYGGKVEKAGLGYEASPHLRPSPNHHGMRDYRRLRAGVLLDLYLFRHPLDPAAEPTSFAEDTWLADHLGRLVDHGAKIPDLLREALDSADDEPFTQQALVTSRETAKIVLPFEIERYEVVSRMREEKAETDKALKRLRRAHRDLKKSREYRLGRFLLAPVRKLRTRRR